MLNEFTSFVLEYNKELSIGFIVGYLARYFLEKKVKICPYLGGKFKEIRIYKNLVGMRTSTSCGYCTKAKTCKKQSNLNKPCIMFE